jgi:hypothetical protein
MADVYRAYSPSWEFIGYETAPQYPGQSAIPLCHCGKPAERQIGLLMPRGCENGHQTHG